MPVLGTLPRGHWYHNLHCMASGYRRICPARGLIRRSQLTRRRPTPSTSGSSAVTRTTTSCGACSTRRATDVQPAMTARLLRQAGHERQAGQYVAAYSTGSAIRSPQAVSALQTPGPDPTRSHHPLNPATTWHGTTIATLPIVPTTTQSFADPPARAPARSRRADPRRRRDRRQRRRLPARVSRSQRFICIAPRCQFAS